MKNIILLALLFSFTGYSQKLVYGTGGTVYGTDGQKIKAEAVRELMKDNSVALKLYNAGRTKKTVGNMLFYGGIGLATYNLISGIYSPSDDITSTGEYRPTRTGPGLAIAGGVLVLASIPVKWGYTKKVKAAIEEHNQGTAVTETFRPDVTIVANGQGLGLSMRF